MLLAIVLVLLGFAFVIAEVFFVSMGMLALVAGALFLGADLIAFAESTTTGWIFVAAEVVLIPTLIVLAFRVLPHLPFGRRMLLDGPVSEPATAGPDLTHLLGKRGRALTPLRPSGLGAFGEERVSVVSRGGLVPRDAEIEVTAVEGAEVRVRAIDLPDEEDLN